jgi:hypothetical protein
VSWYDDAYANRTLVRVAQAAGDTTCRLTIPPDWDEFWTLTGAVQSTGYDIRFTEADGLTLVDHERVTWTFASKVGVIDINHAPDAAKDTVIWMYWGNAAATDASVAVTNPLSGEIEAHIFLGLASRNIVDIVPDAPGATQPAVLIAKAVDEYTLVWFKVDARDLVKRRAAYQGSDRLEEVSAVYTNDYKADGTAAGGSDVGSDVREIFEDSQGTCWILLRLLGGIDGDDNIVEIVVETTYTGILIKRIGVQIRDTVLA